jgi:type VII secretion-associated protein (TIGR03931 family)
VRVARAGPAGAAVVETDADPRTPLAALLAGLVDGPVTAVGDPAVALARARPGPVVVLDVGAAGGDAALVRDGAVVARRTGPGGRHLDEAGAGLLVAHRPAWAGCAELGAEARRVREALSLRPAVDAALPGGAALPVTAGAVRDALRAPLGELVAAVRALAGPGGAPVLVVGGVARTPLLAELLDGAGLPDVRVAARPEAAAVLAALAPGPPAAAVPAGAPAPRCSPLLPAPPRRAGRLRAVVAAVLAAALLAGLHVLGARLAPAAAADGPAGLLAQYDYRFVVPAGWAHTGGRAERRRVLLTPLAAPEGSDLVVVESSPLGYDAAAEPERAAAELRAVYDAGLRAGTALSGYDARARFAGRAVTAYVEDAGATTVRWFVLLDGPSQLSVGCRHTGAGTDAVLAACAGVVATLRRS